MSDPNTKTLAQLCRKLFVSLFIPANLISVSNILSLYRDQRIQWDLKNGYTLDKSDPQYKTLAPRRPPKHIPSSWKNNLPACTAKYSDEI